MDNNILKYLPNIEGQELLYIQNITANIDPEQFADFASVYNSRRRDPQTVLLTSLICFVGVAGVQRFYLGQMGMGFLYLFTYGLCGFGSIYDLFKSKSLAFESNMQIANEVMMQFGTSSGSSRQNAPQQNPVILPSPPAQILEPRSATILGITGFYAGKQLPVPTDGLIFGRDSSSCNVPLQSSTVSRRHAKLSYLTAQQDALVLNDLGSTNGTFVQDKSSWVKISSPVTLTIFKRFRLGSSEDEFEIR